MKNVLSMLLITGLLLAGCGAGDKQLQTADTDAPEGSSADSEKIGSAPEGSSNEFLQFLSGKGMLEYKASYTLTTVAGQETVSSTMTQFVKGEKKTRLDTIAEGVESRIYMVDGVSTICSLNDGSWACFALNPQDREDDQLAATEQKIVEDESDYAIIADGTRVIAGVNAKCYKVTSAIDAIEVRYCFSPEGVPLYAKSEAEGFMYEMLATSYAKSVPESDFAPPAAAQDLAALMGGAGGTRPADGNGEPGADACSYCALLPEDAQANCLASC